jgi:hypothetical protein
VAHSLTPGAGQTYSNLKSTNCFLDSHHIVNPVPNPPQIDTNKEPMPIIEPDIPSNSPARQVIEQPSSSESMVVGTVQTPVNRIPDEILERILKMASDSEHVRYWPYSYSWRESAVLGPMAMKIKRVCSRWASVLRQRPGNQHLWQSAPLAFPDMSTSSLRRVHKFPAAANEITKISEP